MLKSFTSAGILSGASSVHFANALRSSRGALDFSHTSLLSLSLSYRTTLGLRTTSTSMQQTGCRYCTASGLPIHLNSVAAVVRCSSNSFRRPARLVSTRVTAAATVAEEASTSTPAEQREPFRPRSRIRQIKVCAAPESLWCLPEAPAATARIESDCLQEEGARLVGQQVEVRGWVRTVRNQKSFSFVEVGPPG